MKEKIMLRSKAKRLDPVLRVGKGGISESFVVELKKVLNKRKLVKIKLLRSSFQDGEKKELAMQLSEKTNSEIIDFVGNTVVLYRK